MFRHFWWNKYFLWKEHRINGTFFLFKAGLLWLKRVGAQCLDDMRGVWASQLLCCSQSQCPAPSRVSSCVSIEVVLYSLYEFLLLRWHQRGHRDCAAVSGCHVCQEEKASVPATSSCFPKATFYPCSSCTSKFQCWDLGNKQAIHASKFYLLKFVAYCLKVIDFFDKMILCKIFKSFSNKNDENRICLNYAKTG